MAFGVTEPNAGTDTSRITTRAEKKGDRWVVNGRKVWTTNAQHANRILLLARTSDRDPARPLKGMTLFFADFDRERDHGAPDPQARAGRGRLQRDLHRQPGDPRRATWWGRWGRASTTCSTRLNPERIVIGIEAVGIGRAALERAVQYAKERVVFDRPIGKNQAIAHPLAHAMAQLDAAEMMCLKAAWLFDHGKPCGARGQRGQDARGRGRLQRLRRGAARPSGATATPRSSTWSGCGARSASTRSRRSSQQMALNYLAEHVLGLPRSY